MVARDDSVAIKGIKEGLLLTIDAEGGDWNDLVHRLLSRIDEKRGFFRGARAALDVGARPVLPHELDSLRLLLSKRGMTLWAVVSTSGTTVTTARNLGMETSLITGVGQLDTPEVSNEESGDAAVLIDHTLRSGRVVRHRGSVVIFGDVNPGAEIIAGGNIIVWGRLRGVVHAGADGNENAFVCALDLAPTQLRIARYITVSPSDKRRRPRPEVALVQQGRIIAQAWDG
ncbi:MAG: septum site-determining protein MinC [Anaerolineae bacterium]|nr:septum site-determining protein MinC [Anaerolineae bacterium]